MKSVAPGDEIAGDLVLVALVTEANLRCRVDVVYRDLFALEIQRAEGGDSCIDEISHDLVLPVDRDGLSAREIGEIDPVALPLKAEVDPVVAKSAALDARANAHGHQQIDRTLLEHAGAHSVDDMIAAAVLDHHRVDAVQMQQLGEQQPRGTGTNDADLRAMVRH